MAVQPARLRPADLGVLPVPQRVRRPRRTGDDAHVSRVAAQRPGPVPVRAASVRAVVSRSAMPRSATARSATARARTLHPAVAVVRGAATPWSMVDAQVRRRLRPSAMLLATLIAATMLGLVYVTQMLAVQNARYTVDRLLAERVTLQRTLTSQEAAVVQWGSEAQVTQWAQREGLDDLGDAIRVQAR